MPFSKTTFQRKTTKTLSLGKEALIFALRYSLNIPDDAKIFVKVPGGGDWSNTNLNIDDDTPLIVEWTIEEEGKE